MEKQYIENTNIPGSSIVRVFKLNYSKTLDHIINLTNEAKKDFDFLKDEDIKIVVLSGDRYDRMMAVEFTVLTNKLPKDYFEWTRADDLGFCSSYN